jgi:hypothetical protein
MWKPLSAYERATIFVRNAMHGRAPAEPTPASLFAQQVYHNFFYRTFYVVCALADMILAVWEPPAPIASEGALWAVRGVDFAFLALVLYDLWLQMQYHGFRTWIGRGWIKTKIVVWLALIINLVLHVALPGVPYIARLLRPLLLIERLRNVRKIAGNVAAAAPKIFNVGVLLLLHLLFFSVLGFVLFAGIDGTNCVAFRASTTPFCSTMDDRQCKDYFATLEDSMLHLFELGTTANFPAVMMPAFNCNNVNALFFVAYVVIGLYLLLNLVLAVTYSEFKELMKDEVIVKYARMFRGFDMAFEALLEQQRTTRGSGANNNSAVAAVASDEGGNEPGLRKEEVVAFFACFRPKLDAGVAARFFDVFDSDKRGMIYKKEFRRLLLNFGRIGVRAVRGSRGGSRGGLFGQLRSRLGLGGGRAITGAPAVSDGSMTASSGGASDAGSSASIAADALSPNAAALVASEGSDDDSDMDDDDVMEVLDMRAPNNSNNNSNNSSSSSASSASGSLERGAVPARVVVNPLSAAALATAASGAGGASSSSTAAATLDAASPVRAESERSIRVSALRTPPPVGASAEQQAARKSSSASFAAADSVPSWGNGLQRRSKSTRDVLALEQPHLAASVPQQGFCEWFTESLAASLSLHTTADGYGVNPFTHRRSRVLPKGVDPYSKRGRVMAFFKNIWVTAFFDLAVLINSSAVLAQLSLENDTPGSAESEPVKQALVVQYVTLGVFVFEVCSKILIWRPMPYLRESGYNQLDLFLLLLLGAVSLDGIASVNQVLTRAEASAITFFRLARIVRIFRILPGFGITVSSFVDILPVLARYVTVMISVFYCFAIVGMTAFAGQLSASNPAVVASSYGSNQYYSLNFDTLPGTFLILFYLLLLNDWPIVMEGTVAAVGKGARAFFGMFWAVTVVLVLNVTVAFVIETFSTEKTKREALAQMESAVTALQEGPRLPATSSTSSSSSSSSSAPSIESQMQVHTTAMQFADDWRQLVLQSGVDFSAYHLFKAKHHLDVYDALYKDDIRAAFAETFASSRIRNL